MLVAKRKRKSEIPRGKKTCDEEVSKIDSQGARNFSKAGIIYTYFHIYFVYIYKNIDRCRYRYLSDATELFKTEYTSISVRVLSIFGVIKDIWHCIYY